MQRNRRKIARSLLAKGFQLEQHHRDHDYYFFVVNDEVTPIYTKLSRGRKYKTLGDDLLTAMSRQLHLSKGQFDKLIACPWDRARYTRHLRSEGKI